MVKFLIYPKTYLKFFRLVDSREGKERVPITNIFYFSHIYDILRWHYRKIGFFQVSKPICVCIYIYIYIERERERENLIKFLI